jgi:hypothetical protein
MFWRFRAQAARISTQTRKRTHKPIAVLGAIDHRPSTIDHRPSTIDHRCREAGMPMVELAFMSDI